jgi:hypothetical protein
MGCMAGLLLFGQIRPVGHGLPLWYGPGQRPDFIFRPTCEAEYKGVRVAALSPSQQQRLCARRSFELR